MFVLRCLWGWHILLTDASSVWAAFGSSSLKPIATSCMVMLEIGSPTDAHSAHTSSFAWIL